VPFAELEPIALAPRTRAARCDRREAQLRLERERIFAMALAVRGIAQAWDTGLLGGEPGAAPFEREVLGLIGIQEGLAGERVKEAEAGVQEALEQLRVSDEATAGKLLPIDELTADFGLSKLGRIVLMLVAAPQLWGEVERLYRILGNDPERAPVDEDLLRRLLGPRINPHDLAHEVSVGEPLRRGGLIRARAGGTAPFQGLIVDPLVLARLRCEPLDADPERSLTVLGASKPLGALRVDPAVAERLVAATSRVPASPLRLVVRGRPGSGRRTLLAALAAAANRRLALVNVARLGDRDGAAAATARALERCRIAGWLPCVEGIELLDADDRVGQDRLRAALAAFPAPLTMRLDHEARPPLEPGHALIELPPLSESERLEVWRAELAGRGLDADVAAAAARWRIGPATIHRVVDEVQAAAGAVTIDAAVAQHLERRLGDIGTRIRDLPRLADIVLPGDILDSLTEFLSRMRHHRLVFEQWGMGKVATTARGITALFEGRPGTGKTMVAGALARELGLDLYRVDLSRIMSKWIGETERNLATVFATAEESHAILLFDEADSLFTKRTEVKSSNDRFANLEVNYLLARLDSFVGVAILTTNFGTAIDPAFKRRLSFRVIFPVPDEDLREQLWRSHLPPEMPTAKDLNLAELARRYELTGGSVRNCVLRAAFLAAAEDKLLGQDHLLRAIRLEYRSAGKLSEGGPLD
jgi:AAA+ superfamily predicted ATPase